MVKSLQLNRHGRIEDALFLVEENEQRLDPGQIRVKMDCAPINPADINLIEGNYPIPLELPCTIGNEGTGTVMEVGKGVEAIQPGQRVVTQAKLGSWCERRIVSANEVVVVPDAIPPETAAMITVNPPTAWRMIHDFAALMPGDWIIQNAANSVVGRSAIHIAKKLGLRTINIVRREELIEPLKRDGADVVIVEEEKFSKKVSEAVNNANLKLGLNAVGGNSAREIAKSLSPQGCLVTFGAMGMQPMEIPNGLLIFKNISFHGFWLTQWYKHAMQYEISTMFEKLFEIFMEDQFEIPVEKTYPLEKYPEAIEHAKQSGRSGKILFTM